MWSVYPIEGVTLEDCVAMARHAGAEIWRRFQIPVYLYEAADYTGTTESGEYSPRPVRRNSRRNCHYPARKPDFGEPRVHSTAGATVVARASLDCLNIFLNTADVAIAKRSPRPCAFLQAACVTSKGGIFSARIGQVSMNLTDLN